MFVPGAISATKRMLAVLWPDLGGVSEVLSNYIDVIVDQHQGGAHKGEEEEATEVGTFHKESKEAGLRLLCMYNLHLRSPTASKCVQMATASL